MLNTLTKKVSNRKGFTLIELIVVIAIIAILA
ncbi:MAG: prepilin-type N-terminal cleavage/methylation domain-containing protein, partial [Clostridiales bacterium]|nr:prepilin-type N-terminal cleavage/methylation domain-containing protein [Clostridiales bacterium]